MSTDYRYTIRRKADDKQIAEFYYNMIKNLYDVQCAEFKLKLDPENIRGNEDSQVRYTVDDINNDIEKLESHIKILNMKIFEKKMLVPATVNRDIKDDIEAEIFTFEEEIKNCMYAIEALSGLNAIVHMVVEDQVNMTMLNMSGNDRDNDEHNEKMLAYVYNAIGLPKTKEGYDAHLWASDVYIEALACY